MYRAAHPHRPHSQPSPRLQAGHCSAASDWRVACALCAQRTSGQGGSRARVKRKCKRGLLGLIERFVWCCQAADNRGKLTQITANLHNLLTHTHTHTHTLSLSLSSLLSLSLLLIGVVFDHIIEEPKERTTTGRTHATHASKASITPSSSSSSSSIYFSLTSFSTPYTRTHASTHDAGALRLNPPPT